MPVWVIRRTCTRFAGTGRGCGCRFGVVGRRHTGAVQPAEEITCVDCGGRAFLFSHPPEDGWEVGDVVAYRCEDCRDRWDLVLEAEDLGLERE